MTYVERRYDLFRSIPKGLIGAEVGVQSGAFACDIDAICSPSVFHLVDCWKTQEGIYSLDPANVAQEAQDALYKTVLNLAEYHKNFKVCRMFSNEAAEFITDELDWVYLDANHSYKEVFNDLRRWSMKIKEGGCIMGHDFVDNGKSRQMGFGVVKAVEIFCLSAGWKIAELTTEEWSSYKLVRDT